MLNDWEDLCKVACSEWKGLVGNLIDCQGSHVLLSLLALSALVVLLLGKDSLDVVFKDVVLVSMREESDS